MAGNTKIVDKGYKKALKRLTRMGRTVSATVGIQGVDTTDERDEGAATNLQVGTAHEFGINVPERSFMRATFDQNEIKYRKLINKGQARARDGRAPVGQGLFVVGNTHLNDIKGRIQQGIPPPLKDETIANKGEGGTTPLIDTGQLQNSLTVAVDGVERARG